MTRRYMITVRTIDGTITNSYNDYDEAIKEAKKEAKTTNGLVILKDNMNGTTTVIK